MRRDALAVAGDAELSPSHRSINHRGEEVEILNLKRKKLQKLVGKRLPAPPPLPTPAAVLSIISPFGFFFFFFCTIWSQLESANEAKSARGKGK